MVNFETEKNLIRRMFKEIDAAFENDGAGIEDTFKAKGVIFRVSSATQTGPYRGYDINIDRTFTLTHAKPSFSVLSLLRKKNLSVSGSSQGKRPVNVYFVRLKNHPILRPSLIKITYFEDINHIPMTREFHSALLVIISGCR